MPPSNIPSSEFLLTSALIVSLQMAQGRTVDEIGVLSAFLTVVADNLALIATRRGLEPPP